MQSEEMNQKSQQMHEKMADMMNLMAQQSSMWMHMMKDRKLREREEIERRKQKEEDEEQRRMQQQRWKKYEKNKKGAYPEIDDEEEAQMVKWGGTIVLPKLEQKVAGPAMDCGDWIARIGVTVMDLS